MDEEKEAPKPLKTPKMKKYNTEQIEDAAITVIFTVVVFAIAYFVIYIFH